jgi:hypothetical protein
VLGADLDAADAVFSADGGELLMLVGGSLRRFLIGRPREGVPEWMRDLGTVFTGQEITPTGSVLVAPADLLARRRTFLSRLSRVSADDPDARFLSRGMMPR